MTRTLLLPLALLFVLALPGVAFADDFEGDDPGECSDGADNDRDGAFDCDDKDCAASPDCKGKASEPDAPPWASGDADEDEDEDDEDGEDEDEDEDGDDEDDDLADYNPSASAGADGELRSGGVFGLGFAAGTISGLSLKIQPARAHSIVLHLGASPSVLNSLAVSLQYRFGIASIAVPNSPARFNINFGPAFRTRIAWFSPGAFIELAGGFAFGASATFEGAPVEIFVEAIPTFGGGVSPTGGLGFGVDGITGVRVFFGK